MRKREREREQSTRQKSGILDRISETGAILRIRSKELSISLGLDTGITCKGTWANLPRDEEDRSRERHSHYSNSH